MNKTEALDLLKRNLKQEKLIKHCLAVAKIMQAIAEVLKLSEEENVKWQVTGLLHDLDYESCSMKEHGLKTAELLKGKLDEEQLHAIKAHNYEYTQVMPKSKLDLALLIADQLSGLIIATALVMPTKKLSEVKLSTLQKKFKQRDFARSCNRNKILLCQRIGINLDKLLEISLSALQAIASDLGL